MILRNRNDSSSVCSPFLRIHLSLRPF